MHLLRCLLVAVLLSLAGVASGQAIFTYAGGGGLVFGGDGGAATDASLDWPSRIAVDAAGNLYIADFWNKRVRKVDRVTGIITTIAGNGTGVRDGDGGQATAAGINYPTALAFDGMGNLYIAADSVRFRSARDYVNEGAYIRKVSMAGIISTIAGNGTVGYSGDGGPATAAGFDQILGMASDTAGNIILTGLTYRVRRIDAATGTINTIAGNGIFAYSGDGVPATAAAIGFPQDVAADRNGNIIICTGGRIRKVDVAGIITTIAGDSVFADSGDGGAATAAHLYAALGITVDRYGNIYFSQASHVIRKIDTVGIISRFAGNGVNGGGGDGGPPDSAQMEQIEGVAADTMGSVYVSDVALQSVRVVCGSCRPVGISPVIANGASLDIWPQPTDGHFFLRSNAQRDEEYQAVITDMNGVVQVKFTGKANANMALQPDMPPGIYFVKVASASGIKQGKLVICK